MADVATQSVKTAEKVTKVEELRLALEKLNLDTRGNKSTLKSRMQKAKKRQEQQERQEQQQQEKKTQFDYYLFFDVEATCEENGGFSFPNEIIEFPVVLVEGKSFEIVDEFRSYVRPTVNSVLSDFCVRLTGIDQATVDASPAFVDVLNDFQEFLSRYSLFQEKSACFVTDGPFDIRDFVTKQCAHSKLKERPSYFTLPWIDIRRSFRSLYKRRNEVNINYMLKYLKLSFEGRPHSGLDDARNLVAIAKRMRNDGCRFPANSYWQS